MKNLILSFLIIGILAIGFAIVKQEVEYQNKTTYVKPIASQEQSIKLHHCNWEDCEHQGEIINQFTFQSQWGYEEMTDGWCTEMTHFTNPSWTYEQCEDYVFSGVE